MNLSARRLALLLAALAMLGPFSIDTFFPAFRLIGAEFGVSPAAMQQTISVYLISYAVMSLFHGPLSDALGRRRTIIAFTGFFALASAGCALAPSFTWLLACRALQGVAAGAGLIVGRAIIRDRFDTADAQRLMSQVMLIFGAAPALAPIIGGWMLGWSGWRGIFAALSVFSLLVMAWCLAVLPETLPADRRRPLGVRELSTTYAAMLRDSVFRRLSLAAMFNFGGLFLYIASAPTFILDVLHLNERQFAWLFVPAISGMMIGAFLSGRLAGRRSPRQTIDLGFRLMAAGAVVNLIVSLLHTPGVPWSVLPIGLGSIGIALAFPSFTLLVLDRFPTTRGAASSLQSMFPLLCNAILSGLVASHIAHDARLLACGSALLMLAGFTCWRLAARQLPVG